METFSSALLYEICRFIQRLLFQEIWRVTAIRYQHDIILNGGKKSHKGLNTHPLTRDFQLWFGLHLKGINGNN